MPEVLVLNPRNRLGRFTKKRRRNPVASANPRKRRRRRRNPVAAAANPRKRRYRRSATATRRRRRRNPVAAAANPRRRRRRATSRRIRRRNPRMRDLFSVRGLTQTLAPAFAGAAGAVTLDVALSYVPLPAFFQSILGRNVARLAGAVLLGAGASVVFTRRTGYMVTTGALTVAAYAAMKDFIAQNVPQLQVSGISPPLYGDYSDTRLGYISPAPRLSAYMQDGYVNPATVNGVGAYMRDTLDTVNAGMGYANDGM